MIISDITTLVSTCGFPIFACIYLVKSQGKQLEKLAEMINKNTNAIEKLCREVKRYDDHAL